MVKQDWKSIVAEAVTGPVIAVLFWFQIVFIVIISAAHGKLWEANFFEAFGAVGQVALAAAVFWLGWQQFTFTKEMTARQIRLELHDRRTRLINEYAEWSEKWLPQDGKNTNVSELTSIALRSRAIFSRKVGNEFGKMLEEYSKLHEAHDNLDILARMNNVASYLAAKEQRKALTGRLNLLDVKIKTQMMFEIDTKSDGHDAPEIDFGNNN